MRKGICSRENADRAGVMMMMMIEMVKHRVCDIGKACVTSVRFWSQFPHLQKEQILQEHLEFCSATFLIFLECLLCWCHTGNSD